MPLMEEGRTVDTVENRAGVGKDIKEADHWLDWNDQDHEAICTQFN